MTPNRGEFSPFFSMNIQAMRGVAALMIALGHFLAFSSLTLPSWLGGGLIHTFAYAGVDIFFVISGVVVTAAAQKCAERSKRFPSSADAFQFIVKRVFRIYPIYWIVFLSVCLFSTSLHLRLADLPSNEIVSSFFLVLKNNPLIPQAWTLVYEGYFYVVLACIIFAFPRIFYQAIVVWMLVTLCISTLFSLNGIQQNVFSDPLVFEFGLGSLVQLLSYKKIRNYPYFTLVVGVVFFVSGAYQTYHVGLLGSIPRLLSFGLGSAFIVYSLVTLELGKKFTFPKFMNFSGNISYSIYLWHELLIGLLLYLSSLFDQIHLKYPLTFIVLMVCVVMVVSSISYKLIERPFTKLGYSFLRLTTQTSKTTTD